MAADTPHTAPAAAPAAAAAALQAAPDSVLAMPREAVPCPFDTSIDHALAAAVRSEPIDLSLFRRIVQEASAPPAWTEGHPPGPRIVHPAGHSVLLGALALMFVACMLAFSRYSRAFTAGIRDLWSVRNRENAFDETGAGRRRVQVLLAVQFSAYCGVLLYAFLCPGALSDPRRALMSILALMLLAAGYYLFQLCAYAIVGYVFDPDPARARQWVDGFCASQGLAGIALALPTLGLVFYPDAATAMLIIAASIYIAARLIFIGKGFRIFYTGFPSLVYFILYLCTLEIVPALCVCGAAGMIVGGT